MFLTAVSLAVAAVPEGLPAVVTIALALGAQRMLKRNALIRKLPAVETLGSVTTICSDKTGTLTKNEMTVAVIDVANRRIDISTDSEQPAVRQEADAEQAAVALLLTAGELCNDAVIESEATTGDVAHTKAVGDPTETALVSAATQYGLSKSSLEQVLPRVDEVPFDSERKRMTTVHSCDGGRLDLPVSLSAALAPILPDRKTCHLAFTKGAVDSLFEVTSNVWTGDHQEPLDHRWRDRIQSAHDHLAENGMRVLGVGFRTLDAAKSDRVEDDLTFVGLVGIVDPPRPEAQRAVETCKSAGIRPVMITGDHPLTGRYIAGQLGIDHKSGVLTGRDLDELSGEAIEDVVEDAAVYARVTPEHKLKLVEALQRRGHVVAMTGDGVNDAPALKKADIGVAMGITGTDVSKEAADMILLDDNFATIVTAVEQGRIIFDNIRKFIRYLLSANVGEIWVMLVGPFLGMPMPLWPLQILWMNLVTDGLPALALGVEPAEKHVMKRRPYSPGESIFARGIGVDIIWIGLLMGFVSLGVGFFYWYYDLPTWQTMLFTTLTLSQIFLAMAVRSSRDSLFRIGILSNKPMLAAIIVTFALQVAVVYAPPLQGLFKTVPLSARDFAVALVLSTIVFWSVELRKLLARKQLAQELCHDSLCPKEHLGSRRRRAAVRRGDDGRCRAGEVKSGDTHGPRCYSGQHLACSPGDRRSGTSHRTTDPGQVGPFEGPGRPVVGAWSGRLQPRAGGTDLGSNGPRGAPGGSRLGGERGQGPAQPAPRLFRHHRYPLAPQMPLPGAGTQAGSTLAAAKRGGGRRCNNR